MGHAYFMFESVLLRIYVDKKKKKRQKRFPGSREVFVVFHRMPERHRIPLTPQPSCCPSAITSSRLAPCPADPTLRQTRKKRKLIFYWLRKSPQVIFPKKVFDDARKNN